MPGVGQQGDQAPADIEALLRIARGLSSPRRTLLRDLAEALARDVEVSIDPNSDILTAAFVESFSGRLLAYHAMNEERMTKKAFEYAFRAASRAAGREAELTGNPVNAGADATVDGVRFSLKTEAAQNISRSSITISKLMEARWIRECRTGEDFASATRRHVGDHLRNYQRMLTLRSFDVDGGRVEYHLVEVPLDALHIVRDLVPADFTERTRNGGSSARVKIGEATAFTLRLDGSVEKITLSGLRVARCRIHGSWVVTLGGG